MTRVGVLISSLAVGGAEKQALGLIAYLDAAGFEVEVVTFEKESTHPELFSSPRLNHHPLDLFGRSSSSIEGAMRSASRVRTLRAKLLALQPNLVISFMTELNILACLALSHTSIPLIVCERSHPNRENLSGIRKFLRQALYPKAKAVVVQTEGAGQYFENWCNTRIIPNYVLPPANLPSINYTIPHLISLGRLIDGKGVGKILDAYSLVEREIPGLRLDIWGDGLLKSKLEERAEVLEHVRFQGFSSNPYEALSSGSVFVFASKQEGFPNALAEAMAAGLAVVSFDCEHGPGEMISHGINGILVPCGSTFELTRALRAVCRSQELREKLGQNARAIVEKNSFPRFSNSWCSLIDDCIKE